MPTFDPIYLAILIVGLVGGVMGVCGYLTLGERKISAWMQDRVGPNRVGPGGLLQPLADGGKFFLKEEVIPDHVDKVFYLLAPAVAVGTALLALAIVPFGATITMTPSAPCLVKTPSLSIAIVSERPGPSIVQGFSRTARTSCAALRCSANGDFSDDVPMR